MRTVCTIIFILITLKLPAQVCGTHQYTEQLKASDLTYSNNVVAVENIIHEQKALYGTARITTNNIIKIPVVVHVLYHTAAQNISDAQIRSQIDALNRDYRRKNADSVNTPDRFKNVAADIEIEFALATADPNGSATTGIIRKYTNVSSWQMDDQIKFSAQGGDDGWDSQSYLNIWVGNMLTLLGYSSVPGGPAAKDGVVISTNAFGTINTLPPYNLGRTAVHEIGHWLSLRHVWGDADCGDDYVDDTPKQEGFTSGCPNGFRTSCNNAPLGDMYMNYMDFTNDACLNLFTEGQKERMRSLFGDGGVRRSILFSKGLHQPWTEAAPLPESNNSFTAFTIYPNPAPGEVTLNFDYDKSWIGKTISIININGVIVQKVMISSAHQKINITSLSSGIYILEGENGTQKIWKKLLKL